MLKLAGLFLGAIIGAGFASGAELVTFFGGLALPPAVIAVLVGVTLFGVISLAVVAFGGQHPPQTPLGDRLFRGLYLIFLMAMTAGVRELAGVMVAAGSLVLATLLVAAGPERLSRVNGVLVTFLLVILVIVCWPRGGGVTVVLAPAALPLGVTKAILYAGLNAFVLPKLISVQAGRFSRKTFFGAGAITAAIIAGLTYLILRTVTIAGTTQSALPLPAAVPGSLTFTACLLAMMSSQYSVLLALTHPTDRSPTNKNALPFSSALGFLGSWFGFKSILAYAYPVIGGFICVFLLVSCFVVGRQSPVRPPSGLPQ